MKYNGAFDDRTEEEKSKDHKLDEVFAFGSVVFQERAPVSYIVRNQDGSGSCVAQTDAKMLEVWDYKHDGVLTVYSATPTYQNRTTRPAPGMNFVDGLGYSKEKGTYLEADVPSQNMSDKQMDEYVVKAPVQGLRPTNYVVVADRTFHNVASVVQVYGAVMLWFKCSYEEWSQDVPTGLSDSEAVRHSVTAVDIIKFNGVEHIVIEDSWGTWLKKSDLPLKEGQRAITKEFFDKHCYFAGAYTYFEYEGGNKPKHVFNKYINYGETSAEVKSLQEVLKYEKFFPSNQECTGFFGGITAKALIKWQVSHGITDFQNEKDMRKVRVGKKTLDKLNELYN